ncbi:MAG: T9SS type A sorting domain-containing protein [Candidatus Marinimicrobia bacterium]|nr:T9SS type A sorting domain-containing protein [Candidatus Neomarinimicrobiota bacterium]
MKHPFLILAVLLINASMAWAQSGMQPEVIRSIRNDKSPPLRILAENILPPQPGEPRIIPMRPSPYESVVSEPFGLDPALQEQMGTLLSSIPIANWEGISDQDNSNIIGSAFTPPDPTIDVGPDHVVQMVNILFAIYDKQGDLLLGPLRNNVLWAGFGGPCQNDNDGDPIVLYDHLADRWILSQFTFTSDFSMCYAVSVTGDPTGAYYRYEFPFDAIPDYPKLGVWHDAYYATFRVFGAGLDMVAGAMERDSMLVGAPAQMVLFSMTNRLSGIDGVAPADLDGDPPAVGTPGFFMGFQDAQNRVFTFKLGVDWATPSNSTFNGPIFLSVDPFDSNLCGSAPGCIPQPNVSDGLATNNFALMHRLAFRDFGSHRAMVANHTVDVDGNDHAGIRWYELRDVGAGWTIYQQGTYAPDSDHRWMGSIAMDPAGNIGLAYSVSSNVTFPSIRFSGHSAGSALGIMDIAEVSVFEGTGSQTGSGNRWGDYSMLTPDPSADATFWLTGEYYATTSSFNFKTRIAAFILESNFRNISVSPGFAAPGIDSVVVSTFAFDTTGLKLFAEFVSNDIALDTIRLYDDGVHFDGEAGDSIFANAWPAPPVEEQQYRVNLLVTVVDINTTSYEIGNIGRFTTIGPVLIETVTLLADTIPDSPDRLLFKLTLRNDGSTVTANAINATVSTADTCIAAIIEDYSTFGEIASGTFASAIDAYIIDLNENCTGAEDILFDLSIASGGSNFWRDSFVVRPRLVTSVTVSPTFVAPEIDSVVVTSFATAGAGINLSAVIETPDNVPFDILMLFDDGAHYDGEAGDGLFGNAWPVPSAEERHYFVNLQVTIAESVTFSFEMDNVAAFSRIGPVVFETLTFLTDTIPNPGDKLLFRLTLRNDGSTTEATAISADISTTDTCVVSISKIAPTYGDIGSGETSTTTGAYSAQTNESCEGGENILFDISISSEGFNVWEDSFSIQLLPIGITDEGGAIPVEYALGQNYPNPFNPTTTIKYALPTSGEVLLTVYDLLGKEVARIVNGQQPAGYHEVTWDASSVASGIYFYRLHADGFVQTKKMVLLK